MGLAKQKGPESRLITLQTCIESTIPLKLTCNENNLILQANTPMPLKVVVVGAGLAGLGAAIALSRSGHEVLVGL